MRARRYLKADGGEHSYNINDVYADLLLTPLEKLNARVKVVGKKIPTTLDKNEDTAAPAMLMPEHIKLKKKI